MLPNIRPDYRGNIILCMLWRIDSDEFDEEHKKDDRDKKDGWR